MQRKNRFLALLLTIALLTALFPATALMESEMDADWDVEFEQPAEGDVPPDEYAEAEPPEEWADDIPAEEPEAEAPPEETIESLLDDYGYAYVLTLEGVTVYAAPDMAEPIFTITQEEAVLFAIEYGPCFKVCFLTEESALLVGYVSADAISNTVLWDEDLEDLAGSLWAEYIWTDFGDMLIFVIQGVPASIAGEEPAPDITPEEPTSTPVPVPTEEVPPTEEPTIEPIPNPTEITPPSEEPTTEPVLNPISAR